MICMLRILSSGMVCMAFRVMPCDWVVGHYPPTSRKRYHASKSHERLTGVLCGLKSGVYVLHIEGCILSSWP